VSLGAAANVTMDSSRAVLRIGKPYSNATTGNLNASIIFGNNTGSINVYRKQYKVNNASIYKYDMAVTSNNKLVLNATDVSISAPISTLDISMNSSTANIYLGRKDSLNNYKSSIIFGGTTTYGYIRGYKRTSTNADYFNVDIVANDIINLSASGRVNCDAELYVDNDITCTGELITDSDMRLKSDIRPLDFRGKLNPVTYVKDNRRQIGFISQDVEKTYPELVHQNENGYLGLNYPQLTAALAAQVNHLEDEIRELKSLLIDKGLI